MPTNLLTKPAPPKVYVVLVSWNGWQHTIECLESLYRSDYPNFEVIIVDNASADNSADRIQEWAQGRLHSQIPANSPVSLHAGPPLTKPISFSRLSLAEANKTFAEISTRDETSTRERRLVLIDAGSNLGFGRGNNAALNYLSARGDADYLWLLNNDTVVEPSSVSKMMKTAQTMPTPGIIGSMVRYYSSPEEVQAFGGGYFSSLTGAARLSSSSKQRPVNFIFGASFMISKAVFDQLGGFDEKIFMYFEEVEYCIRARQRKISLAVSDAQLYHKSAVSTGDSYLKWKYIYQSRVYTMLKHFSMGPWIFFNALNWLTNVVSPFVETGKKKASREAFRFLAQSISKRGTD